MFHWAIGFFVMALVASMLGLHGVDSAIGLAWVAFLVFLLLAIASLLRGHPPR